MLKNRKKPLYLLSVFALICVTIVLSFWYCDENRRFEAYCNQVFQSEASANTLSLHYTLAHPENFGLKKLEVTLPTYQAGDWALGQELIQTYICELEEFCCPKLSEENQYTYSLLLSYFDKLSRLEEYPYYEAPFSPVNGIHSQLPILLTEYTFRSQRDVEDYLSLLSQTDDYLNSLLEYQKDKTKAGLGTDDLSLSLASQQCNSLITEQELAEGTHFLQTSFEEKLMALHQQGLISEENKNEFEKQNHQLLATVLYPTYQNLSKGLNALQQGNHSTPLGLSSYPKGKEYYSCLVGFQTGSSANVTEMKNTLEKLLSTYRITLSKLLTSSDDSLLLLNSAHNTEWFPSDTIPSMLSHLNQSMSQDFPPFPGQETPNLTVKEVSNALADTSAPAFYLTPPFDETLDNTIYLNPNSPSDCLTLYTTLAHEGYPGHLYQTVYYNCHAAQQELSPIRHLLSYEGYQEGWALYVEFLSYDYLSALAEEKGKPKLRLGYEIEKHNRMMQLCLYSLIDIYIHYEGYTPSQIQAYLAAMGISDGETANAIYQYIANAPGNYLKYFWSYLEILSLKKQAENLWTEAYSDLAFHQFFLERGPSDFASLSNALALKKSLKLPSAF